MSAAARFRLRWRRVQQRTMKLTSKVAQGYVVLKREGENQDAASRGFRLVPGALEV